MRAELVVVRVGDRYYFTMGRVGTVKTGEAEETFRVSAEGPPDGLLAKLKELAIAEARRRDISCVENLDS